MFVSNSMCGASNAVAGSRLYQARDAREQVLQRRQAEEEKEKEGPAATFERSGMEEYMERMASLQKRVLKLKERIEEVKNDTVMDAEKKDSLLSLLTESLSMTQKQLDELKAKKDAGMFEEDAREEKEAEEEKKTKKERKKEQGAVGKDAEEGGAGLSGGAALIAAGSSVERLELLRKSAEETEEKAAFSQKQLDHFTQHKMGHIPFRIASSERGDLFSEPVEGEPGLSVSLGNVKHYTKNCVQLDDKEVIGRRLQEINTLWKAADKLVEAATDIMRDENGAPEEKEQDVSDLERKHSGPETFARKSGRRTQKNAAGEAAEELEPLAEEQGAEA